MTILLLAIGDVHLMVTQPCLPCYKLGIRFGKPDMVKQFLESRGTRFYFRVLQEGEVGAGDTKRVGEPGQQQYHCCRYHSTLCW
jgi:MOSC domain-containing protein YiiM